MTGCSHFARLQLDAADVAASARRKRHPRAVIADDFIINGDTAYVCDWHSRSLAMVLVTVLRFKFLEFFVTQLAIPFTCFVDARRLFEITRLGAAALELFQTLAHAM